MRRQHVLQRSLGQHLERAEAVADGASRHRVAALRADHALQNTGVAGGVGVDGGLHGGDLPVLPRQQIDNIHIHGLNHKAVVVIPVETGPVAVHPVPQVPGLEGPQGVEHPHHVPGLAQHVQTRLHHGGEEDPVAVGRGDPPGGTEGLRQLTAGRLRQRTRQRFGRAQDGVGQESRIHQGLSAGGEVHEVRRRGIHRHGDTADDLLPPGCLQRALLPVQGGGVRLQPGGQPQHAPAEGLQRGVLRPVAMEGKGHGFLQFARSQAIHHIPFNLQQTTEPVPASGVHHHGLLYGILFLSPVSCAPAGMPLLYRLRGGIAMRIRQKHKRRGAALRSLPGAVIVCRFTPGASFSGTARCSWPRNPPRFPACPRTPPCRRPRRPPGPGQSASPPP